MFNLSHMNMKIKGEVVFSRKREKNYQTKLSLTWRSASGVDLHLWGYAGVGWCEGHQATGKRKEGFGVPHTGLESHFVHLAV